MIKVENIEVWGFEHAIRGMRNPMNSWDKSDSEFDIQYYDEDGNETEYYKVQIGENDLDLMRRLYKAGTEHRKYLRQIFVSMDITAPHYWWYDFDTYKVGVVRNSCSKNHKLMSKPFELNDFSWDRLLNTDCSLFADTWDTQQFMRQVQPQQFLIDYIIPVLNKCREHYLETKDKKYWWQVTQLLPLSYNHRATITMNYENVVSIIKQRDNHILDEFKEFVKILKSLPYVQEIMN